MDYTRYMIPGILLEIEHSNSLYKDDIYPYNYYFIDPSTIKIHVKRAAENMGVERCPYARQRTMSRYLKDLYDKGLIEKSFISNEIRQYRVEATPLSIARLRMYQEKHYER